MKNVQIHSCIIINYHFGKHNEKCVDNDVNTNVPERRQALKCMVGKPKRKGMAQIHESIIKTTDVVQVL